MRCQTVKKTACGRSLEIDSHNDTQKKKSYRENKNNIVRNESREKTNSEARRLMRRKAACALGNRGLWTAQTRPKRPRVVCVVGGDSSKQCSVAAPLSVFLLCISQSRRACRGNPGSGDASRRKTSTPHPSLVGSTPRKGYASCAIFLPPQKPSDRHLVPCTSHTSKKCVFFRG